MKCPICLMKISNITGNKMTTSCNHCFHKGCINTWLSEHNNCPCCRTQLTNITHNNQTHLNIANYDEVLDFIEHDNEQTLTLTVTLTSDTEPIGIMDSLRNMEYRMYQEI